MLGYKPDALRDKKKRGGRIDGPGTGTSDSIQKDVKDGTYIMPADSTEAIGEQALAGMGRDVPVNVSNGEYEMPPEQVHAVGVQVLDQMKNATHEPVQKPQQGLGYDPELFFADGGVVDEEKRKKPNVFSQFAPQAPTPTPMAPQQQPAGVVGQAMDATQRRMNDPILKNAPQAPEPEQATLGSVVNAGPGAANVGPFEVSHLPRYGKRNADGADSGDGFLSRAWDGAKNTIKEANAIRSDITNMALGYGTAPFSAVVDKARQGLTELAGGDISTLDGGTGRHMDASMDVGNMGYSNLERRASAAKDSIQAGMRSMLGVEKAEDKSPPSVPAASRRAASATREPIEKTESTVTESPSATAAEPTTQEPERYASGIQKPTMVDGVPTFTNKHVRGFDPATANTISSQAMMAPSASTQQALSGAMQAAAARGDFAAVNQALARQGQQPVGGFPMQSGGTRFNVIRDTSRDDALRRKLVSAATTPHRGAQNGQLTRGQIDAIRGLMSDERSDQTKRDTTAQSNQTTLQAEAMRQSGQQARNQLDERRLEMEERAAKPTTAHAERGERLYQAYEQAETPEEKSAIAEQIQLLQGGGKRSENLSQQFMKIKVPVDPNDPMKGDREELVDLRTFGQSQGLPPIGQNPAAIQIKNNTKLSAEEKAKQLRALGYQ